MRLVITACAVVLGLGCRGRSTYPDPRPEAVRGDTASMRVLGIDTTRAQSWAPIQRANRAAAAVVTLTVDVDSLVLRVGEAVNPGSAMRIEARDSAGQLIPDFAPFIDIEDLTVAEYNASGIVGLRPGRTVVVIRPLSLDPNFPVRPVKAAVTLLVEP